ncbi:MAG: DUF116 domain-containing protein [Proteobacteria bacterium]|nr:DUF116 domain-containing protein [Pseudomonadota bacterium]
MSHFKQYQGGLGDGEGRNLGDEWLDWDGRDEGHIREGKALFLMAAAAFALLACAAAAAFVYLIAPRIAEWHRLLPPFAWLMAALFGALFLAWYAQLFITVAGGRKVLFSPLALKPLYDLVFSGAFRVARLFKISRDRMGHSFIKVSNSISRAVKPADRQENLLILLPRCLTKEQLQQINALKEIYPITIHTVSGGELARKKVKEVRPTAVIGVACERDLVSGIRDVGTTFSVIGITNRRPEGPCRNTHIDMQELIGSIEFFVGPPKNNNSLS